MSKSGRPGVARNYTSARRHPWVLGKLGDWTIWFGPYTPAQLVVIGGGAFALIKGYDWWSWAGPIPVALWVGAVWAVRGAQIAGQNPFTAAFGALSLGMRHPAGRIGGRVAREKAPGVLRPRFVIQCAPTLATAVPATTPVPAVAGARVAALKPAARAAAGSGLARLLADAEQTERRSAA
ncbi:hypothetical protein OG321_41920 [Streptomyces sp. NBC_00424]|uniref:hypothetical protein n=1 Tax=Streptomyces sp. NBC_00424 TaxID=2903648 RepID=UPI0022578AA7|nr:hypothetical protein [Streptomyces sp. NBC_00424]MCX5078962.1 hypothetical protein [Streptomyces sp. NBC_00424]